MTWEINQNEFESVLMLPAKERYLYTIKRIVSWGEIWSLWSEKRGWVLAEDDEKNQALPIWPHEQYANACASEFWEGSTTKMIGFELWLEKWLPGLEKNKRLICVFPTPRMNGVVVTAERLKGDLEEELINY
jgi:hypothetical protein